MRIQIQCLFFSTYPSEIKAIITNLKDSSPGYDGISAKILKSSINYLLNPLVHVINLSLTQGIFPKELKTAKVLPLYKSQDKMSVTNYRPISILPVFSKIFEKIMYKRLLDFIKKHKLLYKFQFGFRESYGTNLALTFLTDKIMKSLDNNEIVVGLFLDFTKAFDTLNHTVLINKLHKYGIRGNALNWIKSYLSDRNQFVCFNDVKSSKLNIQCGIPQGSLLGSLLFLIYINNIVNVSKILFFLLFADDTNVFLSGKNINKRGLYHLQLGRVAIYRIFRC